MNEITLKYGMNPHQSPARVFADQLPIEVVNGAVGFINLLDALNAWQLVRELKEATGLPAATSFKHVSPTGAAVGLPLDDALARSCMVEDLQLSPLAQAYARARGADRVCSFGDFVALSDPCDEATARIIAREVSDGLIAPGFEPAALELLRTKLGGAYRLIRIDPSFEPAELEQRQLFGVTFEQRRNDARITTDLFKDVVTAAQDIPPDATRDLVVATITLKYTQSNSIVYALGGQAVGIGAGQQSRIHCTRLAGDKADTWWLRQHPRVLDLPFKPELKRPDRNNAIDGYLRSDLTAPEQWFWESQFTSVPNRLTQDERYEWLAKIPGVSLASDAYIPFRDNIDRAARSGVRYIAQPGHSKRDDDVIAACDEYGIAMAFTGLRLFHH